MINYSIIIPHHNIPDLLKRCLKSIPDRDDLETIIVDDNSSPDIINFSNFPGRNKRNCHIIFDKNGGGAGHARNVGLEHARGKWLIFADADDFFMPCFNEVLDASADNEADVIYTAICCLDTELYTNVSYMAKHIQKMLNKYTQRGQELDLRYLHTLPWAKIIKKKIVDDYSIRFDETIVANDVTFSYLIGYYANNITINPHAIYCYTIRAKSLSRIETNETNLARVYVMGRKNLFFKKHNLMIKENWQYRQLVSSFFKNKKLFIEEWALLKKLGYSSKVLYYNFILSGFKMFMRKMYNLLKREIVLFIDD